MVRTRITEFLFHQVLTDQRYHAYGDERPARCYEVFVAAHVGRPLSAGKQSIGYVYTASSESWDKYGGVRTTFRGYTRTWRSECVEHRTTRLGGWSTRHKAAMRLLEHYERVHEGWGP